MATKTKIFSTYMTSSFKSVKVNFLSIWSWKILVWFAPSQVTKLEKIGWEKQYIKVANVVSKLII